MCKKCDNDNCSNVTCEFNHSFDSPYKNSNWETDTLPEAATYFNTSISRVSQNILEFNPSIGGINIYRGNISVREDSTQIISLVPFGKTSKIPPPIYAMIAFAYPGTPIVTIGFVQPFRLTTKLDLDEIEDSEFFRRYILRDPTQVDINYIVTDLSLTYYSEIAAPSVGTITVVYNSSC